MNDKQLADALVERGIGRSEELSNGATCYEIDPHTHQPESEFVNDWRVAGACMERMSDHNLSWFEFEGQWVVAENKAYNNREWPDKSLPRAIVTAYVEATDEKTK